MKESPIFIKTYETMVWVLQHTAKFPKNQRFLLAKHMEDVCLDLYEKGLEKAGHLFSEATAAVKTLDLIADELGSPLGDKLR